MENVASNNTRAVIKNCSVFAGRNKDTFGEYKSKVRVCLSLYSKPVFDVFQGMTQPSSRLGTADNAALDIAAERRWQQANHDLWSILFLTTSGSANNVVKKFEGKRLEDGTGNGQAAWNALNEKYNSHTKEARRACHKKLVNTKMEPGQDPDDFFFIMDKCRDRLEEMGQTIHDERYEDIILQALPAEYERVRIASYEKRDFGLDDIRHMVHTMYVDNLSRPVNHKPVAGRSIAMQATGHNSNEVRCNYCKGVGHLKQDCATLKAKEHRQRHNQWEQHTQSQPSKSTTYHVKTKGSGKHQWCSFHKSTTHSDADCRVQHRDKTNGGHANCARHSCHPAVLSTRTPFQGCGLERPCISFTAVEAATEEDFWPFGPTDEPDASFGHSASVNEPSVNSGLFGAFGGITGEKDRITGVLMTIVRGLMMVAVFHYMWLLFGSSVSAREASTTSNDQTEFLGGITNAEDGSALKVGPVVGVWNGLSNDVMNVLVDSGASGHYFDDTIFLGLRDNLDNYQELDVPRKITTTGKGHLYSFDRSFEEGKMNNHSNSSHLATIVNRSALSDFRGLGLYTKNYFPDVAHEMYRAESVVKYAYAATNIQIRSERGKSEIFPNTFKEAMTLPAKAQWKAASDKEVASLKRNNVYTLLPATSVPTGHKVIRSRWVYKIKADNTYKGRLVVLRWAQLPWCGLRQCIRPRLQAPKHPYGVGDIGGV